MLRRHPGLDRGSPRRVAVEEPPTQHRKDLNGHQESDQEIEGLSQAELSVEGGGDFLTEFSRAQFKNQENEEQSADHQSHAPHPILIVEESQAKCGREPHNQTGRTYDNNGFFARVAAVHENTCDQFEL